MYYVYILQNSRDNFYKGLTNNLNRRLEEHNRNKCPGTRGKGLWKIRYFEKYKTRKEARKREKFLKSGVGREFLKRIFAN